MIQHFLEFYSFLLLFQLKVHNHFFYYHPEDEKT